MSQTMSGEQEFLQSAAKIKLVVLDVDGVMTDGSICVDDRGVEMKRFHVRDGFGVRCWQRVGGMVSVISGRTSSAVSRRCRELDISPVIQGMTDKTGPYQDLLASMNLTCDQVCFMGDDLPDLPLILKSGVGATVADADPLVVQHADWVSTFRGGQGAVRELFETLLTAQEHWSKVAAHYSRPVGDGTPAG